MIDLKQLCDNVLEAGNTLFSTTGALDHARGRIEFDIKQAFPKEVVREDGFRQALTDLLYHSGGDNLPLPTDGPHQKIMEQFGERISTINTLQQGMSAAQAREDQARKALAEAFGIKTIVVGKDKLSLTNQHGTIDIAAEHLNPKDMEQYIARPVLQGSPVFEKLGISADRIAEVTANAAKAKATTADILAQVRAKKPAAANAGNVVHDATGAQEATNAAHDAAYAEIRGAFKPKSAILQFSIADDSMLLLQGEKLDAFIHLNNSLGTAVSANKNLMALIDEMGALDLLTAPLRAQHGDMLVTHKDEIKSLIAQMVSDPAKLPKSYEGEMTVEKIAGIFAQKEIMVQKADQAMMAFEKGEGKNLLKYFEDAAKGDFTAYLRDTDNLKKSISTGVVDAGKKAASDAGKGIGKMWHDMHWGGKTAIIGGTVALGAALGYWAFNVKNERAQQSRQTGANNSLSA